MPPRKVPVASLSVQVTPELKQALREQAKRAGLSLSEWVRTRLELEATDPDEVHAFLVALDELAEKVRRSNTEDEERRARQEAKERAMPAELAAARREGRALGEKFLAAHGLSLPPSTQTK